LNRLNMKGLRKVVAEPFQVGRHPLEQALI